MHTVVETPTYLKAAASLFTDEQCELIVDTLAADPEAGQVMPGTGGYRKLRFGRQGMGKRGGARLIYLYGGRRWPVFLITAYAKNEKGNLSQAERNALKQAAAQFFSRYGGSDESVV